MEPFARKLALPYRREDLAVQARTEEYVGVTLLASNRTVAWDEAFLDRFDLVIDFPLSGECRNGQEPSPRDT
ncbi:MAG TPA: hypothetical protein VHQ90_24860 [Thermoanaerobaculia bacterium]|nr:hypothetical protein [Thermoanaerobaculia bacterium]